jgi:hypothetical protein
MVFENAFHRTIAALPSTIINMIRGMVEKTGWSVSVIAGGPRPSRNGAIEIVQLVSVL